MIAYGVGVDFRHFDSRREILLSNVFGIKYGRKSRVMVRSLNYVHDTKFRRMRYFLREEGGRRELFIYFKTVLFTGGTNRLLKRHFYCYAKLSRLLHSVFFMLSTHYFCVKIIQSSGVISLLLKYNNW